MLSEARALIDNGQHKSTYKLRRILFLVPNDGPLGIMRILEDLCMLLPKALKIRAIKDTMALLADSIGGTCQWYLGLLGHLNTPCSIDKE